MESPKKIVSVIIPEMESINCPFYYEDFCEYYPSCEMETKKWFVDNIKSDWNIIDAGANIGYFSILFSRLAPNGIVFSFEPTRTYDMLISNLKYNNASNEAVAQIIFSDTIRKINIVNPKVHRAN